MSCQVETGQLAPAHRTQQFMLPSAITQDTCGTLVRRSWIPAQYTAQESATCTDATEREARRVSILLEHGKRKQAE